MKQILVELDDRCARDLERVASVRSRRRAQFIRLAIRHAVDVALERETAVAYAAHPLPGGLLPGDMEGWDPDNGLSAAAPVPVRRRPAAAARR